MDRNRAKWVVGSESARVGSDPFEVGVVSVLVADSEGLPAIVGKRVGSTSVVPSQKLVNRDLRLVSDPKSWDASCEWEPGMEAVTPRMGSVSSCSGDGSASGEISTRAAAHRIVAAVAWTSVADEEGPGSDVGAPLVEVEADAENEFRSR